MRLVENLFGGAGGRPDSLRNAPCLEMGNEESQSGCVLHMHLLAVPAVAPEVSTLHFDHRVFSEPETKPKSAL